MSGITSRPGVGTCCSKIMVKRAPLAGINCVPLLLIEPIACIKSCNSDDQHSTRPLNSDSDAVLKRRAARVNFRQFLLLGNSLVLFKRQPLCPVCFYFMRINDDDDDDDDEVPEDTQREKNICQFPSICRYLDFLRTQSTGRRKPLCQKPARSVQPFHQNCDL